MDQEKEKAREVAQYLMANDYLLTALEFFTELSEDGLELKDLRFHNNS